MNEVRYTNVLLADLCTELNAVFGRLARAWIGATAVFILAIVVFVALGSSAMAQTVTIRTSAQENTGRIVFNWSNPVSYKAVMDGQSLQVSFSSAIEGDVSSIQRTLGRFISNVSQGDSGRALILDLTGDFYLAHYPSGTSIIVELTNKTPTEAPVAPVVPVVPVAQDAQNVQVEAVQPEPEPKQEPITASPQTISTEGLPDVKIRTGRHPDKLRIVFDWTDKHPYEFERTDGNIKLTFNQAARIEAGSLATIIPSLIGAARSDAISAKTLVQLSVAPGAKVSHFYAGAKVVVDVFMPRDGSVAAKQEIPAQSIQSAQLPNTPQPSTLAQVPPAVPVTAVVQADAQAEPNAPPVIQAPVRISDSAGVSDSAPTADQFAPPMIQEPVRNAEGSAGSAGSAGTSGAPSLEPALIQAPNRSSEDNAPTSLSVDVNTTDGATTALVPNKPYDGESSSSAGEIEDGFAFRFDWDEPTGAAVFRRGGALWVVFDNPGELDIEGLLKVSGKSIINLVQLKHPEAVILRAITAPGINPLPRKDGLTWILEFRRQSLTTQTPIESLAEPESPLGARVFLPIAEPRPGLAITDPDIGDNFIVVPVVPAGYGVNQFYKYPQFRVRPSSQGVVIEPVIDTLQVRSISEGISIASSDELYISPVTEADMAKVQSGSSRPLTRIVDFTAVQGITRKFYTVDRQDLEHAIIYALTREERLQARLNLARFFLAHDYAQEASGVLQVTSKLDKKTADEPAFYVYSGIANWMAGRYDTAAEFLAHESLNENDEGEFWRAINQFSKGNSDDETIRIIRSTSNIPITYPPGLRSTLMLKGLDASIQAEDFEHARTQLEIINALPLTPKYLSETKYLSGLMNEVDGKSEDALSDYEVAISTEYEPIMVRAKLAHIMLELKIGRLTPPLALVELEKLRFAWRGGDFEFDVLRKLGTVYIQAGGFRQGLQTLKQAASFFRNKEEAIEVTQQMSDVFTKLFLEGQADEMLPISAISLYEEFRELTPAGNLGDEMIQKLADRLVSVDLLGEASALLDSQVRLRLKGETKARVGAQLAVVLTLSKNYEEALNALMISQEADLPEQLQIQRRHLRARAFAGLGDDVNALLLLEEDESRGAEQLRADIYRMTDDWPRASGSLGKLVNMSGALPDTELNAEQASYILSHAIALALSKNDRGLGQLRSKYEIAMRETSLYDAYKLIASPEQFGLINYSSIASQVKEAEKFQSFMADYRARLDQGLPLSSIN